MLEAARTRDSSDWTHLVRAGGWREGGKETVGRGRWEGNGGKGKVGREWWEGEGGKGKVEVAFLGAASARPLSPVPASDSVLR